MSDKQHQELFQSHLGYLATLGDIILGKIFWGIGIIPILIFLITVIPAFFTMISWNWLYGWLGDLIGVDLAPMPFIVAWGLNVFIGIMAARIHTSNK